tara:strand:- start:809 stop:1051 length:243 start_codon:yes stop_codon:yes gene_type:complete
MAASLVHPSHASTIRLHPALDYAPELLTGLNVTLAVIAGYLEPLHLLVDIRLLPIVRKPIITVFTSVAVIASGIRVTVFS